MSTVAMKSEGRIEDPNVTGKEIARLICDAVGLPVDGLREININITAGQSATVTVKRFLPKSASDGIVEKLSQFVLCRPESIKGDEDE